MKVQKTNAKDYAIIINLIIFFTVITVVGITRLVIIIGQDKQTTEEYLYITNDDMEEVDTTDSNLKIEAALEKIYDINIYYGDSTLKFAESVNAIVIKDSTKINTMLTDLTFALQKYPYNIIEEMNEKGYTVSIYLVDHFTNNNVALANRNSNNEFKIYISNNSSLERAMHHETYHILEYYMALEYGLDNIFGLWNTLNPTNFQYPENIDEITTDYVYGKDTANSSYFITLYSKYSAKEDRAEIFAESMILQQTPKYYSERYIKNKAMLIYKNIDECFTSAAENRPNYWEKYL